jgi:hypothetical protein
MFKILIFLSLYSVAAFGAATRTVDADQIRLSNTSVTITLPTSQGASNTFLKNNGSGTLTWSTFAPTYEQETPSGSIDGSNTSFTLAFTPTADSSVQIYLNGVFQEQTVDYTISGANLTFISAPSLGQRMKAVYTR